MKIVYISNYMNHHVLDVCDYLYSYFHGEFEFISLIDTPKERLALGYENLNDTVRYVTKLSDNNREQLKEKCFDCDILLVGSAEDKWFIRRLNHQKPVVKLSERFFKYDETLIEKIKNYFCGIIHIKRFRNKRLYYLCCSAYTKDDVVRFSKRDDNLYKWGYFPKKSMYDYQELIRKKKNASIVWAARFIDWKHPEALIFLANKLKKDKYNFHITMIGNGPLQLQIANEIDKCNLCDCITLVGSVSPDTVREYMEESSIFLMTSDRKEGWGAVLNEAMSSACAVVADCHAGSPGFLIDDGKNGFLYSGNYNELAEKVEVLLDDSSLCRMYQKNAYMTIVNEWSPEVASKRLSIWLEEIYDKKECHSFLTGPCSRA